MDDVYDYRDQLISLSGLVYQDQNKPSSRPISFEEVIMDSRPNPEEAYIAYETQLLMETHIKQHPNLSKTEKLVCLNVLIGNGFHQMAAACPKYTEAFLKAEFNDALSKLRQDQTLKEGGNK